MQQPVCMMCHEHNSKSNTLNRLYQLVKINNVEPDVEDRISYLWGHHDRCRFGIPCNKIDSFNRENDQLARSLEPYLTAIAKSGNAKLIHECLNLLRGNYPQIYHVIDVTSKTQSRKEKAV